MFLIQVVEMYVIEEPLKCQSEKLQTACLGRSDMELLVLVSAIGICNYGVRSELTHTSRAPRTWGPCRCKKLFLMTHRKPLCWDISSRHSEFASWLPVEALCLLGACRMVNLTSAPQQHTSQPSDYSVYFQISE